MDTQTDIEIYVMKQSSEAITQWLKDRFDSCTEAHVAGRSTFLEVTDNGQIIPVNIVENAAGKAWTSIWFNSPHTPWAYDADCAREIRAGLACRVRCNASFWQEQAGINDEWLEIDEQGKEGLINWPS